RCTPLRPPRRVAGSSSKTLPGVTAWPSAVLPIRRSHVGARVSASDGSGNQRSCWLELRLGVGTQGFSAIGGTVRGGHLNSYPRSRRWFDRYAGAPGLPPREEPALLGQRAWRSALSVPTVWRASPARPAQGS